MSEPNNLSPEEQCEAVPLTELLTRVPEDVRLGVPMTWALGTEWHPIGSLCHRAAARIAELEHENGKLRRTLIATSQPLLPPTTVNNTGE
jgi:hypothetical protein